MTSLRVVIGHAWSYLKTIFIIQGAIVIIGFPVMALLLELGLNWSGVSSLTPSELTEMILHPLSDRFYIGAALILVGIIGTFLVYIEIAALMSLARRHQSGAPADLRSVIADVRLASAKLAHPSMLLLIPYFFILLPLGNIGLGSMLTRDIALPAFISGELMKTTSGTWLYVGAITLFVYLNLRFVYTIANFVGSRGRAGASMAASWRMTSWIPWRIAAIFFLIYLVGAVLTVGAYVLALLPTEIADDVAPDAAPFIAGVSLTLMQIAVFIVFGFMASLIANATVYAAKIREDRAKLEWYPLPAAEPREGRRSRIVLKTVGWSVAVVLFLGVSLLNVAVILTLSRADATLVIAHRGVPAAGVENSIPALDAAAEIGAEFVELDIQETKDRELVVMHDATLSRLAGDSRGIGETTLAELREVTLTQGPFEASIPTLDEFIERALELDINLLIELKPRGDESPEYMDNVVAAFVDHDVADRFFAHSLSKEHIEELEARVPELETGYILALNIGHAPDTTADFVVIEESAYSLGLLEELREKELGLVVWTVNEAQSMRNYFRDDVDGIITDYSDIAMKERTSIREDTGTLSRLDDEVSRLFGF